MQPEEPEHGERSERNERPEYIGRLLKDADLTVSREVNARMRETGVTSSQGWLLAALYFAPEGALSLKEIEALARTSQPSVWGVVSRMEKAGLVEVVVNPHDARARLVRITEEGRARSVRCQEILGGIEGAIDEAMTPEERAQLVQLLQRLAGLF